MVDKEHILIRDIPKDVSNKLTVLAKQLGFKSRQAYLLDVLTKLANENIQFECEDRYVNLMEELKQVLLINANVLKENQQAIEENSKLLETFIKNKF